MASLVMAGITVTKTGRSILSSIDLAVPDGELMALVGPSGSGKTTLLRTVAGLETVAEGTVSFDEHEVTALEPAARNVAMVFQESVLYPFLTVGRNVAFPLEMHKRPAGEIALRVQAESRALGIEELIDRDPRELSAGHRQLVQIAKAMVRAPDVFLMDEPLARLDAATRTRMRGELRMVQRGYGVTTLYVTNDPTEAMALADRLAVVVDGRLIQTATPTEVYRRPRAREAAEMTGELTLVPAMVEDDAGGFWLTHPGFRLRAWSPALAPYVRRRVALGFRPEGVEATGEGEMEGTVAQVEAHGSHDVLAVAVGDDQLRLRTRPGRLAPGAPVHLTAVAYHVFDAATGVAIAHVD